MSVAEQILAEMTVAEFIAFADAEPLRHYELFMGIPVAMAPATYSHQKICGNIDRSLTRALGSKGCESIRDMGVASSEDAAFLAQPDIVVHCGPIEGGRRWISDPTVVVEVLSKSTMSYDRGLKMDSYLEDFPSIRHILLVYQTERRVELWSRDGSDGWPEENPAVFKQLSDVLPLPSVGATLPLADIYDGVELT
jgi:Uma2 family endonuclease